MLDYLKQEIISQVFRIFQHNRSISIKRDFESLKWVMKE
jgi:hypothetical protein